jgi:hypothetical protein
VKNEIDNITKKMQDFSSRFASLLRAIKIILISKPRNTAKTTDTG